MRNETRPPRTYELMTILAPDVAEDQLGPAVDQIKDYITGAGGTISDVLQDSPWGRRRLAYPIRHNGHDVRDGYYTVVHFDLEPGHVADIEREILLNDQIIRFLVTTYTAPAPSAEGDDVAEEGEKTESTAPAAEAETPQEAAAEAPQEAAAEAPEAPAAEAEAGEEAPAPEASTADTSTAPEASADTEGEEVENGSTGATE